MVATWDSNPRPHHNALVAVFPTRYSHSTTRIDVPRHMQAPGYDTSDWGGLSLAPQPASNLQWGC